MNPLSSASRQIFFFNVFLKTMYTFFIPSNIIHHFEFNMSHKIVMNYVDVCCRSVRKGLRSVNNLTFKNNFASYETALELPTYCT